MRQGEISPKKGQPNESRLPSSMRGKWDLKMAEPIPVDPKIRKHIKRTQVGRYQRMNSPSSLDCLHERELGSVNRHGYFVQLDSLMS